MADKNFKSRVEPKELEKLNNDVWEKGRVDREHLLHFLTLLPTSEAKVLITEVSNWLESLHNDPKYSKIVFPQGDIDAIIGDLDSYGRVQPETILDFKQSSNKTLPIT